jgi:hypothetical protein
MKQSLPQSFPLRRSSGTPRLSTQGVDGERAKAKEGNADISHGATVPYLVPLALSAFERALQLDPTQPKIREYLSTLER